MNNSKNIIYWAGIKNPIHADKYGGYEYFEYSKRTWQYFCERYGCTFVEFSDPVESDLFQYRINWQKIIFVFDELERRNINYDQIALVDSTSMYKWDAPNFFELTENKFVGWRDTDNMRWTRDSIDGYESFFNFKLDSTKYINSGFIIFNSLHKSIALSLQYFILFATSSQTFDCLLHIFIFVRSDIFGATISPFLRCSLMWVDLSNILRFSILLLRLFPSL